tara:strand:+ start:1745 stop:2527 length:783 start_codon:yes stop_codon:yes gene_type:complete
MKTPYISLKNINTDMLDQKYALTKYIKLDTTKFNNKIPGNSNIHYKTKLIETKDNNSSYSYIDEAKRDHMCVVTMKNYITQKTIAKHTNVKCFHCHHSFDTIPLGCPLEFKCSKIYKNYYSEITKNNYILQESISKDTHMNEEANSFQTETQNLNFYLVDGIFCSFNCCKAYILDNKKKERYRQSETLLNKIYMELFKTDDFEIIPAPDFRILDCYGGDISIEDYRKNFYKILYKNTEEYVQNLPDFKAIGYIFEKKIKL